MSIPLLIYWVIAKIMPAVDSASFKNGIIVPLVSNVETDSSDGYLSNEMAVSILRKDISPEQIIDAKQHDGYTFDYNKCIQFNNRILCGYDKNKGRPLDDYTMIDIGNGCRARGDRIECGYDNPQDYKNLRQPVVKRGGRGKERGYDKHSEHIVQHGDSHHRENNHHQRSHHHRGHKHHDASSRQAPTRTAAITDPTTLSIILNRIKPNYQENKSLKYEFGKLKIKAEETSIGSVKVLTNLTELSTLTTDTDKPLTTTVIIPTEQKSTLKSKSARKALTVSPSKTTTSTTKTIPTLPTSSESNEISDGETNQKLIRLKPLMKQKRRLQTHLLSTLPKLVKKSKSDGTITKQVTNNGQTTINGAVLRMDSGSAEKKVKTACVEQQDRVVCYDFKA